MPYQQGWDTQCVAIVTVASSTHDGHEEWTCHLNAILPGILLNKQCRGVLIVVNDDRRCILVPTDDVHHDLELPGRLFTESLY